MSLLRAAAFLLVLALFAGVLQMLVLTQAATKVTCKSLSKAALDATSKSVNQKGQTKIKELL